MTKSKNESIIIAHLPQTAVRPRVLNRIDLQLDPEFKRDIQEAGVRVPIIVRPLSAAQDGVTHEIVCGERRWAANGLTGRDTIPAIVREMSDLEAAEEQLRENLQRTGLSALDEARLYEERLASGDYGTGAKGVEALAAAINVSRTVVYARLRLLQLSPPVREALVAGKIQAAVAELLATLPGQALQEKALKRVLENGNHIVDPDDEFEPAEKGKGNKGLSREQIKTQMEAQDAAAREPMSYREVKALINSEFRLDLKEDAPWKLDDASLLPEAGPCSSCPKRSGTILGAFADIKNPNLCTDPHCFAAKRAAHNTLVLQAHVDKGHQVMTPEQNAKAFESSYGYLGGGWVEGDHYLYDLKGGGKKAKEALGKSMPAPTYGVDRDGKVRACYKESEIKAVAREKGLLHEKGSEKPPKKETPEAKAKREAAEAAAALEEKIERTVRREAVNLVLAPIESGKNFGTWLGRLARWLFGLLDDADFLNHDLFLERRGLKSGHPVDEVKKCTGFEALAAVVETLLAEIYDDEYDEGRVDELAKVLGLKLDRVPIEKRVRADLSTPTPKEPKATPKSSTLKTKKKK